MTSFNYTGYYIVDIGGEFLDALKEEDIKILLDKGMLESTNDPFGYDIHKDYFLDDIMDELEGKNGLSFERVILK